MTVGGDTSQAEVVSYWWSKAAESLASARRELDAKAYMFAVNRIYYAAFYAACAALLERHRSFRKHSGVRAAFHSEYIKTGLMDIEWGKFYDHLFEDRQEADYVALTTFEPDYVRSLFSQCASFLNALRPLIPSLSRDR